MSDREKIILKTIIEYYIDNGESVASRTIEKKYDFGISSATIRNTMLDLEEMGYLRKTHTSSGRIPTVDGYRIYLSEFLDTSTKKYHNEIIDKLTLYHIDVNNLFKSIVSLISKVSSGIGFLIEHSVENKNVSNANLTYINEKEAFITMVINEKFVRTARITFNTVANKSLINEINKYIDEIINVTDNKVNAENLKLFLKTIGSISTNDIGEEEIVSKNVYLDGMLNLVENQELDLESSIEIAKNIFNNKDEIDNYLQLDIDNLEETKIQFGIDINEKLKDITIIYKTYMVGKNKITIGNIGGLRTDYSKVLAYLDSIRDISDYIIHKNNIRKMLE